MCFETTKSARAKIAKTDIVCWKVILETGEPLYRFNPRLRYRSGIKKPVVAIIKERINNEIYSISKGYHSYKSVNSATKGYCCFMDRDIQVVFKFIIPAGTRYFENETQYVSETIMML